MLSCREPSRFRRAVTVAVPSAVMLVLGLWGLDRGGIWRDEAVTFQVARRSVPQIWRLLHVVDAVHGLYYLFMHAVLAVRADEVLLRLPSVCAAALTAGLVAALGTRLARPRVGLWAGLLYAVTPMSGHYAQEGRSYALVAAGVTGATLLLVRAVTTGGRSWWAYGGVVGVTCWLHEFAVLLLLAHAVTLALARAPWRVWRGWAPAAGVVVVALVPVVLVSRAQSAQLAWLREPGTDSAEWLAREFLGQSDGIYRTCLALAVLGASRTLGRRGEPTGAGVALPLLLVPPATLMAASLLTPLYVDRYVLYALAGAPLLTALGAERLTELATRYLRHRSGHPDVGAAPRSVLRSRLPIAARRLPGALRLTGSGAEWLTQLADRLPRRSPGTRPAAAPRSRLPVPSRRLPGVPLLVALGALGALGAARRTETAGRWPHQPSRTPLPVPGPDTPVPSSCGPGLDTAALHASSGPDLDAAVLRRSSGSGQDTAVRPLRGPGPDAPAPRPPSGPGQDGPAPGPSSCPASGTPLHATPHPLTRLLSSPLITTTGALAVALVFLLQLPLLRADRVPDTRPDNLAALAALATRELRPGDPVLFLPGQARSIALAYPAGFRGMDDVALARSAAESGTLYGREVGERTLRHRLAGLNRVWVVAERRVLDAPRYPGDPTERAKLSVVEEQFTLREESVRDAVSVRLYVRRPAVSLAVRPAIRTPRPPAAPQRPASW
ncbi:glycosyltransferase family 39 protein [Streptomyces sp. YIM S03343]